MSYDVSLIVPFRHDDWGYRENNWWTCWRWWNTHGPKDIEICVSDDDGEEPFNRSRARNKAIEQSHGDILVIADADTLVDHVGLTKAIEKVGDGKAPWVIPYNWYYNMSKEYTDLLNASEKPGAPDPKAKEFSFEHKILSWAGILVVPRTAALSIGGYDERFEGWGHEDVAFRIKLDAEWGHPRRTDGNAYHYWHPINKKETFNSPSELANRRLFQVEYVEKYDWKDERLK